MKNKKQCAVIGAGHFGRAHIRNFYNLSDLIAICDTDRDKAKNSADLYDDVRHYTDVNVMLKEEKLDAVSVVTPPSEIPKITRICANAGVDVLMEKPMGLDYNEVESIATEFTGVRLHPGFIELYNPVIEELHEYLPKIGTILNISSKRIGLFPRRYWGMGVLLDLGTHDVYLHQNLLGEVENVKSMVRYFHDKDKRFEDAAYALLDFGETKSMIESNWLTPTKYRKMWIMGEEGTIEVDFVTKNLTLLKGKELTGSKPEIWETTINQLVQKEPLSEEILDFLYADKPKITLQEHGLKTLRTVLDILKKAQH